MLHAFTQTKSRKVHANSLSEDEVTSTFFGPLPFMATRDVWAVVQELEFVGTGAGLPSSMPHSHEVLFWKRFKNPARKISHWRACEPDVVFQFSFEKDQILTIIVEVKWTARGSSTDQDGVGDQLARQWVAVRGSRNGQQQITMHVYLTQSALEASRGLNETPNCDVVDFDAEDWCKNAKGLTWADIGTRLTKIQSGSEGVRLWATAALKFLRILNVTPFTGFRHIDYADLSRAQAYTLGQASFHWPDILTIAPELTKWGISP
ncbi:hypothetical protein [Microvirga sp. P5_D2]